jgi:hypothetical protein
MIANALNGDVLVYIENKRIFYKFWFVGVVPSRFQQVSQQINQHQYSNMNLDRTRTGVRPKLQSNYDRPR